MPIWRRTSEALPAGVYDELLTEATQAKLERQTATHHAQTIDVGPKTPIDDQLITLVRDTASVAIRAARDTDHKLNVARRLLQQLSTEAPFRDNELALRPALLRSIAPLITPTPTPPRESLLSSGLITNAHGESVLGAVPN